MQGLRTFLERFQRATPTLEGLRLTINRDVSAFCRRSDFLACIQAHPELVETILETLAKIEDPALKQFQENKIVEKNMLSLATLATSEDFAAYKFALSGLLSLCQPIFPAKNIISAQQLTQDASDLRRAIRDLGKTIPSTQRTLPDILNAYPNQKKLYQLSKALFQHFEEDSDSNTDLNHYLIACKKMLTASLPENQPLPSAYWRNATIEQLMILQVLLSDNETFIVDLHRQQADLGNIHFPKAIQDYVFPVLMKACLTTTGDDPAGLLQTFNNLICIGLMLPSITLSQTLNEAQKAFLTMKVNQQLITSKQAIKNSAQKKLESQTLFLLKAELSSVAKGKLFSLKNSPVTPLLLAALMADPNVTEILETSDSRDLTLIKSDFLQNTVFNLLKGHLKECRPYYLRSKGEHTQLKTFLADDIYGPLQVLFEITFPTQDRRDSAYFSKEVFMRMLDYQVTFFVKPRQLPQTPVRTGNCKRQNSTKNLTSLSRQNNSDSLMRLN